MKTLIIYHRMDLDGVFSAAVISLALDHYKEEYDFLGWNYGDTVPDIEDLSLRYNKVIAADISFPDNISYLKSIEEKGVEVIWIDHHKTAMSDDDGSIKGKRRIGIAACELAYKYFFSGDAPIMIQFLSAYDVWNHERFLWEDVMAIQYYMRSEVGLDVNKARNWVFSDNDILEYRDRGMAILKANAERNRNECKLYSFEADVLGYKAICINTLEFNSTTFDSVWDEDKYDLMMPFTINPNNTVRCSFYTTKPDVDCGELARRMGGGGHAKAAGFQLDFSSDTFMEFINKKVLKQ